MNLVFGQVISIHTEDGMRIGKVRVSGVIQKASLDLLTDVTSGSDVLLCDGVAISKVEPESLTHHVPRHSR